MTEQRRVWEEYQMSDSIKAKAQRGGYVPERCQLPEILIAVLMSENTDPCAGCNLSREECGGRPKTKRTAPLSQIRSY